MTGKPGAHLGVIDIISMNGWNLLLSSSLATSSWTCKTGFMLSCSLCRFTEPFGQGRQVLWKGMDKDYDALCVKASEALSVNLEAVVA